MHIADGVLSPTVLGVGTAAAAAGVWLGLRRLDEPRIPPAAVLCSAFFVSSLIHVPLGPASVHLMLTGLIGVVLGWVAFPVLLIGLLMQAMMFGHGGVTVLGVNTAIFAAPAVAVHYLLRPAVRRGGRWAWPAGFAAGAIAVVLGFLLLGLCLVASGEAFANLVAVAALPHAVLAIIEGVVTASALVLIAKVKPELLADDTNAQMPDAHSDAATATHPDPHPDPVEPTDAVA